MFSRSLKISREFTFSGVSELGAQELKHQVKLEQWKEQITACRSSGMSVRRWCIENQVNQKSYYRWEKEILAAATNELVPMHSQTPSLSATTFAEVPALPAQPFKQAEIVASIRVGKAKVDLYSGADASVVKALCQALKSC